MSDNPKLLAPGDPITVIWFVQNGAPYIEAACVVRLACDGRSFEWVRASRWYTAPAIRGALSADGIEHYKDEEVFWIRGHEGVEVDAFKAAAVMA
jgi:hypothetical protein